MTLDKYFKLYEKEDPHYQEVEVDINIEAISKARSNDERDNQRVTIDETDVTSIADKNIDNNNVLMLISAGYDANEMKPYLIFYDPNRDNVVKLLDDTGHKPYAYSKLSPNQLRSNDVITRYSNKIIDIVEEVKHDPITDSEVKVSKIIVTDPLVIGGKKDSLREKIDLWEADIKYYVNYLFDQGLQIGDYYVIKDGKPIKVNLNPPQEVEKFAEKLSSEEREWLYRLSQPVINLKRVALDIEVYNPRGVMPQPEDPRHPIFIISLRGSDGLKKVLFLDLRREYKEDIIEVDGYEVEIFRNEVNLIQRAIEIVKNYPILLTFNGDTFDLPYIIARAKFLKVPNIEDSFHKGRNEVSITWGIHIDLYKFFKNASIKNYAFSGAYDIVSLDTIAKALIGKGKVETPEHFDDMNTIDIIKYALTDADITYELTAFNNDLVMRLIVIIARISNMTIDDVTRLAVSNWIRNRLIYLHRRRNYLIPRPEDIHKKTGTRHFQPVTKGKKYVGALVIDPKPGIHFNVVVVDFASLYPSIMKEYNISYETVNCPHEQCKTNLVPNTSTWICRLKKGIISEFVGIIRDIRVNVFKKLSKDKSIEQSKREFYNVIQGALKVFINAIYGVTGSETFQFYYLPSAEAVTIYGRYIIEQAIKKAEKLNLKIIYGDTDSLFIKNPEQKLLEKLMEDIYNTYRLKLEVDKIYKYVVLSSRKKNYFGVTKEGSLDIKGLQGKKSNTPPYIKTIFYDILKKLKNIENKDDFNVVRKEIIDIIKNAEKKLINREVPLDELVISVTISKPLEQYTKTTPQHVKAAKLLVKQGRKIYPGSVIKIVKTRNSLGVKPVELVKSVSEVDAEKYIDLLHSTLEQILEAMNIEVERGRVVVVDSKKSLDKFFKL